MPQGQTSTEDKQAANAGHLTDISISTPAYRYFRYEIVANWTGTTRLQVGEVSLFGQYVD